MEIAPITFVAIDIFLFITFFGIGIYLVYIYSIWREITIGFWSAGSFLVALAIASHALSIVLVKNSINTAFAMYSLASLLTFLSFWCFGVSHILARSQLTDALLVGLVTLPLGYLIPTVLFDFNLEAVNGVVIEHQTSTFSSLDLVNFFYFGTLFLVFARDSHLIYNASIKENVHISRRSIAITHLLAWQFFAVASATIRYISKYSQSSWYFGLPLIFLMVPLLTLGSRPFDWAREGHEPILLLLVDQYGTPSFSWMRDESSPLLLEGSTIATINEMLQNLVHQQVNSFQVKFENTTMYTQSTNNYLSILLTTGHHKSFNQLLKKIHSILVTDLIKQTEFGIPGYELPFELKWLLSQLLPDGADFDLEKAGLIKSLFLRSGIKI